jgi:pimeloyl-ACP methyl ester carboxylesterase
MNTPNFLSTFAKRLKILLRSCHADDTARAALVSDNEITVDIAANIELRPRGMEPTSGIILYPGGRCDPLAYAPLMRELTQAGYLCIIARMPLNLPVLSPDRAADIMKTYPYIKDWTIVGHSLGGAMACRFAARNADKVSALFLLAAYPPKSQDLSHCEFPITLFYGTEDTLAKPERILAAKDQLPGHASFSKIEGGDHYQFGSFSDCERTASISKDQQQQHIIDTLKGQFKLRQ